MKDIFEVCGGSVTGRLHMQPLAPRNNQDAYAWLQHPDYTLMVVCDGCGSSPHSEVGARLAAQMAVSQLATLDPGNVTGQTAGMTFGKLRKRMLRSLLTMVEAMGGERQRTVNDHFLFSTVGAIVGREETIIFSLGDGVFYANGERFGLGPYPGNEPPYLGYGLVQTAMPRELLRFNVEWARPTAEVDSILLATDGFSDFEAAAGEQLPGRSTEMCGPPAQFWADDRYYRNPDMVRRRLALANHDAMSPAGRGRGLLPDDTTLVALRRRGA